MVEDRRPAKVRDEAWTILRNVSLVLAKVVGKCQGYPDVDRASFTRVHKALEKGLIAPPRTTAAVDTCQELRAITVCPIAELLRPGEASDLDTRLAAIAQVLRERAGLSPEVFREIVVGLLSWREPDKQTLLDSLSSIIWGRTIK